MSLNDPLSIWGAQPAHPTNEPNLLAGAFSGPGRSRRGVESAITLFYRHWLGRENHNLPTWKILEVPWVPFGPQASLGISQTPWLSLVDYQWHRHRERWLTVPRWDPVQRRSLTWPFAGPTWLKASKHSNIQWEHSWENVVAENELKTGFRSFLPFFPCGFHGVSLFSRMFEVEDLDGQGYLKKKSVSNDIKWPKR